MNQKTRKRIIATAITVIFLAALGQPVHAQQANTSAQYDRASYIPGDSGTLTVTLINNNPSASLEVRNITIYWPWAQLVAGKWPSGANLTDNFATPWPTVGSKNSGNNIMTKSYSFSIPSWYGGSVFGGGSNCSDPGGPRYDISYHGCVAVGVTSNPPDYIVNSLSIQMSLPTYTPLSVTSQLIPIATLVVLLVATAFLFLTWNSLRRSNKKQ